MRLPVGARMHEFEIRGYLGEGGFSIVYLAWDHVLEREVALKEYMPSSLAARDGATRVFPRSERHRETFDLGLRSFINEGRLLAQFDHASLVKVYRFWEQNGTAYMVMPFYKGITLKERVRALGRTPDEGWLRGILDPLTAALQILHRAQCYHRDIAPDNIILLAETEQPLLLDFGAARKVVSDRTQNLTVILKPGFAPIEQYAEDPAMKQGPWTDVYALSAVVHWALVGRAPPAAVTRVFKDPYAPLASALAGQYSAALLDAVDRGLAQHPEQRIRSVAEWRAAAGLEAASAVPRTHAPPTSDDEATRIVTRRGASDPQLSASATPSVKLPDTASATASTSAMEARSRTAPATTAGSGSDDSTRVHAPASESVRSRAPAAQPAAARPTATSAHGGVGASGKPWAMAAGAAALVLAIGVGLWWQGRPAQADASTTKTPPATAAVPAPLPSANPAPAVASPAEAVAPPAAAVTHAPKDVTPPPSSPAPREAEAPRAPETSKAEAPMTPPAPATPATTAAAAPSARLPRNAASAAGAKAKSGAAGGDTSECARLMALASLGDLSAELRDRKDRACAGR